MLRRQSERALEVAEAMRGYALKFDGHRRELLTRDEDLAYRQALVPLVGERLVF